MRNRVDPKERGQAQSLQAVYQRAEGEEAVKKIFQPPAFLKKLRDDDKYCEKRESYATLNGFKPRLEPKIRREAGSGGKKFRVRQRYEPHQMGINQPEDEVEKVQQRLERIIEKQLRQFREENRVFFNLDSEELKKQLIINSPSRQNEQQKSVSPYAKFSANIFPKKQLKALATKQKSLYPGRDQYFSDLDKKFRHSLRQKIINLQSKLGKPQSEILQVMTIYSIKQQETIQKKKKLFFHKPKKRETSLPHQPLRQELQEKNFEKLYQRKLYSYLAFLQKVNFSNNLPIRSLTISQKFVGQKIKVYVGNGNNKFLLVSLLKRRFWLEVTSKIGPDTKFIWTQNSIKEAHNSQKTYNQYQIALADETKTVEQQNKKQFKAKFNSIKKLMIQANSQQSVLLVEKPNSIKSVTLLQNSLEHAASTEAESPVKTISKLKIKQIPIQQENTKLFINMKKAMQAERNLKHFKVDVKKQWDGYNQENMFLITNHIPHNSFIGSKKALFYTMEHYYRQIKKINPFTIIPKTYHFKTPNDETYSEFLEQQKQREEKSIWIVKPGECTNRGNGITIMRASEVTKKLLKKEYHWNGQLKTTIVQSYLTDPLLYNGRKFDIRHYMLISIVNGNLKAYWYSEGYIRTSSQPFTLLDLRNRFVHLTNDAVQKQSFNYGKYQPGNKLSYSELQRYLDCTMQKKINFKEDVLVKMKEIATDVVKANYLNLGKQRKMNNFELFGLDFMLDRKLNPWLIQINANPCLQTSCPLLSRLIPLMLQHTLRLALDPQLIPPAHYPPNLRYYLPQNFLSKLNYHLIFDELQYTSDERISLNYDFDFDQPEDQYENDGIQMDVAKILD